MKQVLKQEEMQVYKEYATLNNRGVLFIIFRDKANNLHKLVSVGATGNDKEFMQIKSLKKPREMYTPTVEDYNLFRKA